MCEGERGVHVLLPFQFPTMLALTLPKTTHSKSLSLRVKHKTNHSESEELVSKSLRWSPNPIANLETSAASVHIATVPLHSRIVGYTPLQWRNHWRSPAPSSGTDRETYLGTIDTFQI